ncbi:glycosyltransferase family 2 protein [Leifsonia sp. H3M29-4]|uniref:glycosyltransferase family 2 protein n=1 Tax=Salinibacterium metalliresistens TaxID=3031321 RepID=UPI0023DB7BAD|nr:glycosyltransferase family 2 protein [Salinibacterium metalliresistens]MDF1479146.1 glycosyltransferase family 2 protein [Salinibacterium metalliresistens]
MISVALCTHNGERYLAAQLRSILEQSHPPGEIVLSDDASTDGTVALAEAIVAQHGREVDLRVIRNETALGVTANFQQAISATTGELIALSDQDDIWRRDRLELMSARFDTRPELLLLHGDARLVDGNGEPLGVSVLDALEANAWERQTIASGRAYEVFLRRNLAVGATTLFRRSLLAAAVPFPSGWVHDEWLAIIAAASGSGTVDYMTEALVDYRQHGGNQIGARKLSFAGKVRRVMEPRRARNQRLVTAFDALADRLRELPVTAEVLAMGRAKAEHEHVRNGLPEGRLRRIVPIAREVRAGRYSRYGRGLPDIVRDLVQPVD